MTFTYSDETKFPGVQLRVEADSESEARERADHFLHQVIDVDDLRSEQV
jgi:hypothetical protein